MAANTRDLLVRFLGDNAGLKKVTQEVDATTKSLGTNLTALANNASISKLTDSVIEFGKASVNAALEDEASQQKLATTLRNTVGANDDAIAATESFIGQMQDSTGVADDELRPALARLVRATGDVAGAQDLMKLAMDVSAGTGKDLSAVSEALAKAHDGNVTALKRLGIATVDAEGNTLSFDGVVQNLAATFKGQAAAAADTNAGKLAIMKVRYGELQETIGNALLPILGELVGVASSLIGWFSSLDESTQKWIVRLGLLGGGALLALRGVSKISEGIKSFKTVTDLASKAADSLNVSSTGLGLALGGVGLVITAATLYYQDYAAQKAKVAAITAAFAEALAAEETGQKGALAATVAKTIADSDALEIGKQLGLTAEDLTRVILGQQVPAYDALQKKIDEGHVKNNQQGVDTFLLSDLMDDLSGALGKAKDEVAKKTEAERVAATVTQSLGVTSASTAASVRAYEESLNRQGEAARDGTEPAVVLTAAWHGMGEAARLSAEKTIDFQVALTAADTAYSQLIGKLDAKEAWIGVQDAIGDYIAKMTDGTSATGDQEQALRDAQREMANYVKSVDTIPPEKKTEIYALIDQGNLAAANEELRVLTLPRNVYLKPITMPGGPIKASVGATGGIVTRPTLAVIGEAGPEAVVPLGALNQTPGSRALPSGSMSAAAMMSSSATPTIVIHQTIHGSVTTTQDLYRNAADGIVDMIHRGELPPGLFN